MNTSLFFILSLLALAHSSTTGDSCNDWSDFGCDTCSAFSFSGCAFYAVEFNGTEGFICSSTLTTGATTTFDSVTEITNCSACVDVSAEVADVVGPVQTKIGDGFCEQFASFLGFNLFETYFYENIGCATTNLCSNTTYLSAFNSTYTSFYCNTSTTTLTCSDECYDRYFEHLATQYCGCDDRMPCKSVCDAVETACSAECFSSFFLDCSTLPDTDCRGEPTWGSDYVPASTNFARDFCSTADPATTVATNTADPTTTVNGGDPTTTVDDPATTVDDPATTVPDPATTVDDPATTVDNAGTTTGDQDNNQDNNMATASTTTEDSHEDHADEDDDSGATKLFAVASILALA